MLARLATTLFGSHNERVLKRLRRRVEEVNALEDGFAAMGDEALAGQTEALRARLSAGETLDDLLPQAFAAVREAARRTLGLRHYDVQLLGGLVLHEGRIAEMRTGEGKTLVATAPVFLNALAGKGVHVVTVNDYLARRDAQQMGRVYAALGMSTGCIVSGMNDAERRDAYACDITYGTNNELGFDYLRDNMRLSSGDRIQRPFFYAMVDEVDSILIDEARTPLIISGPSDESSHLYEAVDAVMRNLEASDFDLDEKQRAVALTETGLQRFEDLLAEAGLLRGGLYDPENLSLVHHLTQALRAHTLYKRDKHYMVRGGEVLIVDEFTGRAMEGRRFSEGLHQALEAKERVEVKPENQTLATVTYQNLFRLYPKLSGMTGTAMTEAAELSEIYRLEVVAIPTHRTIQRIDHDDEIYRTYREKEDAILALVAECHGRGQPVLVGTASIEKSERLSERLVRAGIPHAVLNAKHHEREARIIAEAGSPGAVTIATNMAGRGTDIQLGGNLELRLAEALEGVETEDERAAVTARVHEAVAAAGAAVRAAGGLYVIGTERHESRRIDNQLRGRSGRQGDPGASKFFLSLEDDLMRIFGGQRLDQLLARLGLPDGEPIMHGWVTKAIARAQSRIEAQNFEIRKNVLKYDDVMDVQRKAVYAQRDDLMGTEDVFDLVEEMRREVVSTLVVSCVPPESYPEQWDMARLAEEANRIFNMVVPAEEWRHEDGVTEQEIETRIGEGARAVLDHLVAMHGREFVESVARAVVLQSLDRTWKDHLLALDHLRQGINLRSYAQRDPLHEYKREAFELFSGMFRHMREDTLRILSHLQIVAPQPAEPVEEPLPELPPMPAPPEVRAEDPDSWDRTARNAPCPCGSGRRYKHCHGRPA